MNPFDISLEMLERHCQLDHNQCPSAPEYQSQITLKSMGFSSWQQAVEHCHKLNRYKKIPQAPLDDPYTLHIRCGTDIQPYFNSPDFIGDYLALIDPLCIGPLANKSPLHGQQRAQFISEHLLPPHADPYQHKLDIQKQLQQALETLCSPKYHKRVFWLEHDNYDQLMWLEALTHFTEQQAIEIEFIEINHFPGLQRFIGLGQLPRHALRYLWHEHKQPLQKQHITLAKQIWPAFCSASPQQLIEFYQQDLTGLYPNLAPVIKRHLQELPHCDSHLTKTQTIVIDILKQTEGSLTCSQLFTQWQSKDPLPFLGDSMLLACIKPLCSYLLLETNEGEIHYRLNLSDIKQHTIQPYSVGGIDLAAEHYWSWDHNDLNSMRHTVLSAE